MYIMPIVIYTLINFQLCNGKCLIDSLLGRHRKEDIKRLLWIYQITNDILGSLKISSLKATSKNSKSPIRNLNHMYGTKKELIVSYFVSFIMNHLIVICKYLYICMIRYLAKCNNLIQSCSLTQLSELVAINFKKYLFSANSFYCNNINNMLHKNATLTLMARGFWMQLECGGGTMCTPSKIALNQPI